MNDFILLISCGGLGDVVCTMKDEEKKREREIERNE